MQQHTETLSYEYGSIICFISIVSSIISIISVINIISISISISIYGIIISFISIVISITIISMNISSIVVQRHYLCRKGYEKVVAQSKASLCSHFCDLCELSNK